VLTFTSPTALSPGVVEFVRLTAVVPSSAPYGAQHLLDITNLQVNGGAIAARDDDGLHLVGYLGDTTGNRLYSALDAALILRVVVGLDSGFIAYALTDPRIVADVSGNGWLSGTDAMLLSREAAGIDQPQIPPLPDLDFSSGFAGDLIAAYGLARKNAKPLIDDLRSATLDAQPYGAAWSQRNHWLR
jgi:hypothetical protein